jgi:hypothetical protein
MRMSLAVAGALLVLPFAALTGCSAPVPTVIAAPGMAPPALGRGVLPSSPPAAAAAPVPSLTSFRWSALAASPLGVRNAPLLAMAGGRLFEFGGFPSGVTWRSAAGAAFDPATGRWQRVASAPAGGSFATDDSSAAWTGRYIAVASGTAASCAPAAAAAGHCWTGAALYDPAANRWTVLALPASFDRLGMASVVWTGRALVFAAVTAVANTAPDRLRLEVAAYSPATGRWQPISPTLPSGHAPGQLYLVDADGHLVLTALWEDPTPPGTWGVDELMMGAAGSWSDVSDEWPRDLVYGTITAGQAVLATPGDPWCGTLCTGDQSGSDDGYLVNPATLTAAKIPASPLMPADEGSPDWIWASGAVLTYSSDDGDGLAVFRPGDGRWTTLPATPGRPQVISAPVWTGSELLALTTNGRLYAFQR